MSPFEPPEGALLLTYLLPYAFEFSPIVNVTPPVVEFTDPS